MPKDRHIKIDLVSNKKQVIEVVQHEHGFQLCFEVVASDKAIELSEYTPVLLVGARELIQANPVSVEGNKVVFDITSNMTNNVTSNENNMNTYTPLELVLYKDEVEQLSAVNMYFKVFKSLTDKADEAVQADNSFDIIEELLNAVGNVDEIKSANEMLEVVQEEIDNTNEKLDVMIDMVNEVEQDIGGISQAISNINLILGDIIGDENE